MSEVLHPARTEASPVGPGGLAGAEADPAGVAAEANTLAHAWDDRARDYPISRWYVRPLAGRLAGVLAPTRVRPVHVTLGGLLLSLAGAATLAARPALAPLAAGLVLAGWFCDRLDGQLARRQGTVTRWGAWLDGNVDELADLALQTATAWAAARGLASSLPLFLLAAFFVGKYLFIYGLNLEEHLGSGKAIGAALECSRHTPCAVESGTRRVPATLLGSESDAAGGTCWLRTLWHLPGNADVRLHLLIVALLGGWLTAELAVVAAYYNLRWIAGYLLVARRLGGEE
jgi:phosphatidylglycerophosphate synthase